MSKRFINSDLKGLNEGRFLRLQLCDIKFCLQSINKTSLKFLCLRFMAVYLMGNGSNQL